MRNFLMNILLYLQTWASAQPSVNGIKWWWNVGKDKKQAILMAINRAPNITYPFEEIDHTNGKKLRWEAAYNEASYKADKFYGNENYAYSTKVFWWREFWHFLGGFVVTSLPSITLKVGLSMAGLSTAWLWFIPVAVLGIFLYKELRYDAQEFGKIIPKNFIDAGSWAFGALLWTLML